LFPRPATFQLFSQKSIGSAAHVCKPKPEVNKELQCKLCSAQLDSRVAWGYHMWKHTKDPSYIQSPDATAETPSPTKLHGDDNSSAVAAKSTSAGKRVSPVKSKRSAAVQVTFVPKVTNFGLQIFVIRTICYFYNFCNRFDLRILVKQAKLGLQIFVNFGRLHFLQDCKKCYTYL
jgi:hypothetical protein